MGRPGANGVSHREGCLRSTTRTPHATSPSPTTPSHTCSHTRRCTATSLGRFIWSVHRDQIPPSPLQCTLAVAAYSELTTSLLQCTAGCLPAGRHEPRMPDTAEVSAARPLQLQVPTPKILTVIRTLYTNKCMGEVGIVWGSRYLLSCRATAVTARGPSTLIWRTSWTTSRTSRSTAPAPDRIKAIRCGSPYKLYGDHSGFALIVSCVARSVCCIHVFV